MNTPGYSTWAKKRLAKTYVSRVGFHLNPDNRWEFSDLDGFYRGDLHIVAPCCNTVCLNEPYSIRQIQMATR